MAAQPYNIIRDETMEKTLQNHMNLYGYASIEVPIIEYADLFLTRAGDKIIDRLFTFDRHGRQLALRPEFTAPAARHYALHTMDGEIARWQFRGSVFEDIPGQAQYERRSVGAELIGRSDIMADAEMIAMASHGLSRIGLNKTRLVSGHVGLQKMLLSAFNLDSRTYRFLLANRDKLKSPDRGADYVVEKIARTLKGAEPAASADSGYLTDTQHMLDVLLDSTRYGTTMGGRTRSEIAGRLINKRERRQEYAQIVQAARMLERWVRINAEVSEAFKQISELIKEFTTDDTQQEAHRLLQDWQQTLGYVRAHEIDQTLVYIEPNLAQNWEYYTGIVFGMRDTTGQLLLGGGRYDELIRIISGERSAPAVGFAFYLNRIIAVAEASRPVSPALLVVSYEAGLENRAITILQVLHRHQIAAALGQDGDIHVAGTENISYLGQQYTQIDQLIMTLKA